MDRVIQQTIVQVLTSTCAPHFRDNSFGLRPGRSCQQALLRVPEYLNDRFEWIVDMDLEKFFDKVPQDRLVSLVYNMIQDGEVESLIHKYLQAGLQIKGARP